MPRKQTDDPLIKASLDQAAVDGVEEYNEAEYAARRSPREHVEYQQEQDPVLAVGDSRVAMPPIQQEDDGEIEPAGTIMIADGDDPIARLARAIEAISQRPASSFAGNDALMERFLKVMERLASNQEAATRANVEAINKGKDPSNFFAPDQSVFNPRGERDFPRPALQCKMFLPWEAERESMTREEIELCNLLEPGDFFITRNDESRIMIKIRANININTGKPERLLMNSETGFNDDYAWLMPSLRVILRQILKQRPHTKAAAAKVRTMEEELDLIAEYGVDFEKILKMKEEVTHG